MIAFIGRVVALLMIGIALYALYSGYVQFTTSPEPLPIDTWIIIGIVVMILLWGVYSLFYPEKLVKDVLQYFGIK